MRNLWGTDGNPKEVCLGVASNLKLSFSTLGCPDWSWEQILNAATQMGYNGVELRGVAGEMYLPKAEPLTPTNVGKTKAELARRGLAVPCLGSSASFHDAGRFDRALQEAKDFIDLAAALEAPYVRVFPDRIPDPTKRDETLARIAEGVARAADYAAPKGVTVVLETHGDFARSADVAAVMQLVGDRQGAAVLWDVHHPYRAAGESIKQTFDRLRPWIRHTHFKDSRVDGTGKTSYCLPGEGDIPFAEAVQLLAETGFDGWLSLEWEKKWHPELDAPEVAFPKYIATMRQMLSSLGS